MTKQYTRDYWTRLRDHAGRPHLHRRRLRLLVRRTTFTRTRPMDGKPGGTRTRRAADIDRAVAAAREAFERHLAHKDPPEKKKIMLKWAHLIRDHGEELALLETLDVGKPVLPRSMSTCRSAPTASSSMAR